MTHKLAGLVLPDRTPIEEAALLPGMEGDHAGKAPRRLLRRRSREQPDKPARIVRKEPTHSRTDWIIVGAGLALAFACAIFPWYIFYNQEEFGTRPVTFRRSDVQPFTGLPGSALAAAVDPMQDIPLPSLDMEATGTVDGKEPQAVPSSQQPFPGGKPNFELVQVANGRAMVRDDSGFWVVQRGSWLPDGSRLASVEKRQGRWTLVTSRGDTVQLSE